MSQIKIPVSLVPRAYVDYDMEQQQILRHDFVLPDGFRVPPLTAARLMALELVCSDFFLHPDTCGQLDIAAALVLLTCRQSLVEELTAKAPAAAFLGSPVGDTARVDDIEGAGACACCPPGTRAAFPKLYEAAASLLNAHGDAILADYPRLVRWCIQVPFYGFDMIPKSGPAAQKPCWFDGEFAGSVIAQASKILSTPVEFVLWETPLCLVWHAIAQHAAAFGVKHVERPPDEAALKQMMTEAAEREARGELHSWQYADPISYGLTDAQANANPALIELFARMRADFEKGGHKPLDPSAYPVPRAGAEPGTTGETLSPPHAGGAAGAGTCTITVAGSFRSADGPADGAAENTDTREASDDSSAAQNAPLTISVQDLSWSLPGLRAIPVDLSRRLAERGDYNS